MNTTSKLSIATLAFAGLLATGCSQQQAAGGSADSSQVAGSSQTQNLPPVETTPAAPAPQPVRQRANPNAHTHPPIPGCTKSITHTHPSGAKSHNHKYGCKGRHAPRKGGHNRYTHVHAAVPGCTKSVHHTHKFSNAKHSHKYSCKGRKGGNNVNVHALQRKLKAKGYYRGPINGVVTPATRSALQRYMQNR